jgi:signal transduction histidine kinase
MIQLERERTQRMDSKLYTLIHEIITCNGQVLMDRHSEMTPLQRDYVHLILHAAAGLIEALAEVRSVRQMAPAALLQLEAGTVRTPVTRLLSYSKMLLEHPEAFGGTAVKGKARACAERTFKLSTRLMNMLNEIFLYARLQTASLQIYRNVFDATSPAFWLGEVYQYLGDEPVSLHVEVDERLPLAYGDEFRTYHIFRILIDNAIKFTHRGRVAVCLRPSGEVLELQVSDTGIGIAAEFHEAIFEPFYQRDPKAPGLGLGLYIAHALATLQNSTLRMESTPGKGSNFYLTVPVAKVR